VPLLPLGPSCFLQTILLSDLVRCEILLQIAMAIWRAFAKFEAHQTAIIVSSGLPYPTHQDQIKRKVRQNKGHYYLQRAVTPDWMGSIDL
jgi:hypothetical protein